MKTADKQHIGQHFRPEEALFIERLQDLARRVEETYLISLMEFLNPRQVEIARSVLGHYGLPYFVSSDLGEAEYARLILAPDYYVLDPEDFEIALLETTYNPKFNQLTHSQIMGSLINQLGIKRTIFGDIRLENGRAQFFVDRQFLSYFTSLEKIGRVPVKLREIPFSQAMPLVADGRELEILVSSMRLDKLIAAVFKIQRAQALKLVETDKVKVNYTLINRPSEVLGIGDLVSVRGQGRFRLSLDKGLSKQGKHKLTVHIYKT